MNETHRATIRRLLAILRPLRGVLVVSMLCRIVNQSLAIALIVLAVWGIMQAARQPSAGLLVPVALALAGAGLIKGVFRYLEQFTGHYVAFRLLADLRHRLYLNLERLCPAGLTGARSGDLVSRAMADIDRMEVFYAHTIAPATVAVVVPLLMLGAIACHHLTLAAALLPWLLAAGLLVPWLAHRLGRDPAAETRSGLAALSAHFTDTVQGIREVLIFGCENERSLSLRRLGLSAAAAQYRLGRCGAFQNAATEALIGGGTLCILWLGARQVGAGVLSPYDLPVVFALSLGAFVPLLGISNLVPDFEQAIRSAQRIFEVMDRPSPSNARLGFSQNGKPAADGVVFEDVSFRYAADDEPVLRGISFEAGPGCITALVGESGAGKSTVAQLLIAFRQATGGRITIAGRDLGNLSPEETREQIALVPQHIHLFNASVRENLQLARPGTSQAGIEAAARLAHIHEFIHSLPRGYDTPMQELGARFSGGQRQRLAIARAFLRQAPILILDEAGAHLDARNETLIFDSLRQWIAEPGTNGPPRTVILIAHRPAWVREADRIHVLRHGRIVESGTHEELHARNGAYADLFALRPINSRNAAPRGFQAK